MNEVQGKLKGPSEAYGTCALCKEDVALIDSHLIPKAAYKHARISEMGADGNPIRISGPQRTACQTTAQVTRFLLCSDCEDLFSKHGEKGIGTLWSTEKGFPLRSKLIAAEPLSASGDFAVYRPNDIANEDLCALRYFAVSVFWRAQVWDWGREEDPYKRALGEKYEGEFRSFLLGESDLSSIRLMVLANTNDALNGYISFPRASRQGRTWLHEFTVLGIKFVMAVGYVSEQIDSLFSDVENDTILLTYDMINTSEFSGLAKFVQEEVSVKGRLAKKHPQIVRPKGAIDRS
ncbi:hypothetical protein ACUTAH_09065 [Metapseudomonas furukawaii]|uniref:hypothetical protein n=1 Tax=Metapseudomonas furukawaii TaxID=1149133 RepID=UPI00404620B9